jgi:Carboxypeptidase regulatory-like domain
MSSALALLALAVLQVPVPVRTAELGPRVPGPREPTGVVRGQVLSGTNRMPLPFAAVELVDDSDIGAVTDDHGYYVLRGVPAGRHILRASHIGHAPWEAEVFMPPGGQISLDFFLQVQPVALPALMARVGGAPGYMDTVQVGAQELGEASVHALESTPGMVELGLGDVTHGTPGNEPIDPSDVLYVRGAAADLKLVLLDGAPVYAPFHLGGLIAPFEADLLSSARLYLGGAPARYDGGISYVLNMQTRAARTDATHTEVDADLLSARTRIEGPVAPGTGYLFSMRTIHALGATAFQHSKFPYGYTDGLLRVDHRVFGSGTITATGFGNRESVLLSANEIDHGTAEWGNEAGSVRYLGPLGGGDAELTVGIGRFSAGLPIVGQENLWVQGAATRFRVAADMTRSAGPTEVQYGASFERQWLNYAAWSRGVGPDVLLQRNSLMGDVTGTYVDASWQALDRLRVRGGLRIDVFSQERAPFIAPRLLVTYLVNDNTAITVAGGQYYQYVRAPESVLTSPDAGQATVPEGDVNPLLAVASATHIVISLDQQLTPAVRLGLEGFHKMFEGVPTDPNGRAQASGVDFWIRRSRGTIQGWLGYSLAWIWSSQTLADPASEIFSGRHLVSAGVLGPAGKAGRFQVRVTYGAGLPFTAVQPSGSTTSEPRPALDQIYASVVEPSPLVAAPDRPYLRVDGELSHTFLTHWWANGVFVTPYLRVLNALNRRDALFYYFDGSEKSAPQSLAALPVVPVVGVGLRF